MELEVKNLIEEGNRQIAALRSEVESVKGSVDTLTEQKLAKMEGDLASTLAAKSALETRLNAIETANARAQALGGKADGDVAELEAKAAFMDFVKNPASDEKKAAFEAAARGALARKSVDTVTGENGGFAVPAVVAQSIIEVARNYSPIRRLARVDVVSTPDYTALINKGGAAYRWGNQMTEREATDGAKLAEVRPTFGTLYADVVSTRQALQDMFTNTETWITSEIAEAFHQGESEAFLIGTGVDQPTGLLHGSALTRVNTKAPDGLGDNPFDTLGNLFFSLKSSYRANGTWIMNSATLAKLALTRNTAGDYLFPQTLQADVDARIFGKEVAIDENMPEIAANSTPVIFGDIRRAYLIADRTSMFFQANPYRVPGKVFFEAEKRVGGIVADAGAAKVLRCAA